MSIKICHASISEKSTTQGERGDQTKKEVCVRSWYSKPWSYMLRYPDTSVANKIANIAQLLADSELVGYSQPDRNSLYNELKKNNFIASHYISSMIKTNTDCSAFVTACSVCAGVNKLQYSGNAPTTSTMLTTFKNAGFSVYTERKYLDIDSYLLKGDILVKPGCHTVIAIESGKDACSGTKCYPACDPKYGSIQDALWSVGEEDISLAHREKIGEANGIKNVGTTTANIEMLKLLRKGLLKKV